LLTPCIHEKYSDLLYVLFDFTKNIFTTIDTPGLQLTEIAENLIRLDMHFRYSYDEKTKRQISQDNGKQIDLTKLEWRSIRDIDRACSFARLRFGKL
jgi:hypothetical protein